MRMRRLKRNLGVSTVVANMMMITITLSLAAILVAWAGTTYGAFSSGSSLYFAQRGQALQERFVIENVFFNRTDRTLYVFVRNVGVEEISVVALYVNGTTLALQTPGTPGGFCTSLPVTIGVGGVCEFKLIWPSVWSSGAPFTFIVATARGNQAAYTARGP